MIKGVTKDFKRLNRNSVTHALDVIQLFFKKPVLLNSEIKILFRNESVIVQPDKNGWFKADIPLNSKLRPGWHKYKVEYKNVQIGSGIFLKPCNTPLGIISDIDDTYLISHSNNTLRKLSVMLFNNITKRKPFKAVVKHYKNLHQLNCNEQERNLIFNVSSSEWNLYPLITQFSKYNGFPNAVILLDELKFGWKELLFSGKGDHGHKYKKIESILKFYPHKKFILIGDDTQRDPWIYEEIYQKYSDSIKAIQIRQNGKLRKENVDKILQNIPDARYFKSSEEMLESIAEN